MALTLCPHCSRPLMSKAAPRCSFCGKPVADGALSWEDQQEAAVRHHVDEIERAAALNLTDDGFDEAGRVRAMKDLASLFLAADSRRDILERFRKGLERDFSMERARQYPTCRCGQPSDAILSAAWTQQFDGGREFGAANAALLLVGVVSWKKNIVTVTFLTRIAGCAGCFGKRSLFDRLERFFGPVPREFRLSETRITPREHPGG